MGGEIKIKVRACRRAWGEMNIKRRAMDVHSISIVSAHLAVRRWRCEHLDSGQLAVVAAELEDMVWAVEVEGVALIVGDVLKEGGGVDGEGSAAQIDGAPVLRACARG